MKKTTSEKTTSEKTTSEKTTSEKKAAGRATRPAAQGTWFMLLFEIHLF